MYYSSSKGRSDHHSVEEPVRYPRVSSVAYQRRLVRVKHLLILSAPEVQLERSWIPSNFSVSLEVPGGISICRSSRMPNPMMILDVAEIWFSNEGGKNHKQPFTRKHKNANTKRESQSEEIILAEASHGGIILYDCRPYRSLYWRCEGFIMPLGRANPQQRNTRYSPSACCKWKGIQADESATRLLTVSKAIAIVVEIPHAPSYPQGSLVRTLVLARRHKSFRHLNASDLRGLLCSDWCLFLFVSCERGRILLSCGDVC